MMPQVLLALIPAGLLFFGFGWKASAWFAAREVARNDKAHSDSRTALERVRGEVTQLSRDLARLQADLPKDYVMRQEWLRFVDGVGQDVKELSAKFDKLLEKLYQNAAGAA